MTSTPLRIGTRGSPLARWQAQHVADKLQKISSRPIEFVVIQAHGDMNQTAPLATIGGEGLFTKAIQDAVRDGRADIAVHSLKDLPTITVPGIALAAVPTRGPTGDAFVSTVFGAFDELPDGATVATSSLRRRAQLLHRRPDLHIVHIRGNVDTRLRKLDAEELDGLVLAEAGLKRLGKSDVITEVLDPSWMLPAVGQGALGLECRADDSVTRELLLALDDPSTHHAVRAERAMLHQLGGGCHVPVGALATVDGSILSLRGVVLSPDGKRRVESQIRGAAGDCDDLGRDLASDLIAKGAGECLLH
jgi:hydroxymethylbilane synthase